MDNNSFNLWLSFACAGSFLEETSQIPLEDLATDDNLSLCNDALARMMEIKARILNAKEELKQNTP